MKVSDPKQFAAVLVQEQSIIAAVAYGQSSRWRSRRGARECEALGLNDRGDMVGSSILEKENPDAYETSRACLWQRDQVKDLGLLAGGENSWAYAINEKGRDRRSG